MTRDGIINKDSKDIITTVFFPRIFIIVFKLYKVIILCDLAGLVRDQENIIYPNFQSIYRNIIIYLHFQSIYLNIIIYAHFQSIYLNTIIYLHFQSIYLTSEITVKNLLSFFFYLKRQFLESIIFDPLC